MVEFSKLRFVFTETFSTLVSPTTVFIWVTCVAIATVAGPFGTLLYMDVVERALYWGLVTTGGIVVGVYHVCRRPVDPRRESPVPVRSLHGADDRLPVGAVGLVSALQHSG